MPQFTAYRNPNPTSRAAIPLLLDVQNELLDGIATRVVVPMSPVSVHEGRSIQSLMPIVSVDGKDYVLLTPQLAGVAKSMLGKPVADLSPCRAQILAALDLLIVGF
jgi:toxin CcdB